ncbi:MAG: VCBS repeat-containing protein [Phycisphaeraceae bacterium]|nr:VCBS repeat-containing protein [Phycisphaeraceae bacterium]
MTQHPQQADTDHNAALKSSDHVWQTCGFEAFRRGTFGNAGQNLYVSRAGILQRIHLFDLSRNGYVDLLFCNSQAHLESPPAYVYHDPLGCRKLVELPAAGAATGVVADFNGDGYDDLVLGMEKSGMPSLLNAFLYYGSPGGLSERSLLHLPAHQCTASAAGDFDGDGKLDLALITRGKMRIFYQNQYGFERTRFIDLDISADQIGAADLDGDGYADLFVLTPGNPARIYWGGPDGLDAARCSVLPFSTARRVSALQDQEQVSEEERVGAISPLAKILLQLGSPHLFIPEQDRAMLVPVRPDRTLGLPLEFRCRAAVSVDVGDINGDGHLDIVFACIDKTHSDERSWIYWGGPDAFDESRRTSIPTCRACDVVLGDLNGNGFADVAICQKQDDNSFSIDSLVYRGTHTGIDSEPIRLPTHGARRVFMARTSDDRYPQLIFVNQLGRTATNDVESTVYFGGPNGFDANSVVHLASRGAVVGDACDFNDDGWADVVIANSAENAMHLDPGSFLFYGGPKGLAHDPSVVIPTRRAWCVTTADVNGDGHLDLVFSLFYDADILIYYGTPEGFDLEHPHRINVLEGPGDFIFPRRVYLADFNNDGWLDLVVTPAGANRCVLLWGGPDGWDSARRLVLPTSHNACTALARDLTGNGYLDLILGGGKGRVGVPHESYGHIFWNGPDGLKPDRQTQLPTSGANGIAVADFNRDGHPDIFFTSYRGLEDRDIDAYIYWGGQGADYCAKRRTRLRAHSSSACLAADFNGDGYIDLAVANHKTFGDHVGDSFVLWNGPKGLDEQHPTRLPTAGPHGMYSTQPGNVFDGGEREYYISEAFHLPPNHTVKRVAWEADLSPKTWVELQLRFASRMALLDDVPWLGPDGPGTWYRNEECVNAAFQTGQWMQYRLALGAASCAGTPRVRQVNIFHADCQQHHETDSKLSAHGRTGDCALSAEPADE